MSVKGLNAPSSPSCVVSDASTPVTANVILCHFRKLPWTVVVVVASVAVGVTVAAAGVNATVVLDSSERETATVAIHKTRILL